MGVKGDNLEINSGLLLSSFIIDYMIIRVKEKEFGEGKIKRTEENERARERERRGQQRHWGSSLLDHDYSVEVGYGLFLCDR